MKGTMAKRSRAPKKTLKEQAQDTAQQLAQRPAHTFDVTAEDLRSADSPFAKLTAEDYAKRRAAVETLMSFGHTQRVITGAMAKEFGLDHSATRNLIRRIEKKWAKLNETPTAVLKQQSRSRILGHITKASSKSQMAAAMAGENLLMKIDGLEAPKKIEVTIDVSERTQAALMRAFSLISPERLRTMALRGAERRRLLEAAEPTIIDAEFIDAAE